ncbi:MAG TPA: FtsH protease activity modulator HflK [Myxococcota bacterium]|jgi:membrane protease subunit HflK|nr:FtsH protease activity modulator HflK [Myxococcota bacterium]
MRAARLLPLLILVIGLGFWASQGFYDVAPDEQAIVLRLGRYDRTVDAGRFHWHAPGLETVLKQRVTTTLREEFGYRSKTSSSTEVEEHPEEKRMLTSDENLVDVDFVVQYRIGDVRDYLLNFRPDEREAVIRDAARAVVRSVVAQNPIDQVLTARGLIHDTVREQLQATLDAYKAGVRVENIQLQDVAAPEPVREAFADVTSAQQDRERAVLEAQGYADKVVPEAKGRSEEVVNLAHAYREKRILEAQGETASFQAVLGEYKRAPEVTRQRLYLETLEAILPKMDKVILEKGTSDQILPYLPLNRREGAHEGAK